MFLMVKGKGCRNCPFFCDRIDTERERIQDYNCSLDGMVEDTREIRIDIKNSRKKPKDCPFSIGTGQVELCSEYSE